jgi:hypothetical protein
MMGQSSALFYKLNADFFVISGLSGRLYKPAAVRNEVKSDFFFDFSNGMDGRFVGFLRACLFQV